MNGWIPLLLAAVSLHAAVIRGTVVSHETGEPLSQTAVSLRAIAGSGGSTASTKTNAFGVFEFPSVPPGAYLLSASRQYFVPAFYGQKRWNSAGLPVTVEENASLMLGIRMHRFGAVTGRVVDENDVGILGHEVLAYRDALPMVVLAHATTDDYGRYRLYGLTPGTYLVRSAAKKVDGVGYLPTYAPSSRETDQSRRVDVQVDLDSTGIDVRPAQGQLFDVAGELKVRPGAPVELMLAGETGRQTINVRCSANICPFKFEPVAPGRYEVYGTIPEPNCPPTFLAGTYLSLPVEKDLTDLVIGLPCVRNTSISYSLDSGRIADTSSLALQARRKDLAGIVNTLNLGNGPTSATLVPGQWEMILQPGNGYRVAGFYGSNAGIRSGTRPDGWNPVTAGDNYFGARFTLSKSPCSLLGVVTGTSHEAVMGAPVYLEGYDPVAKTRIGELRTAYTDTHGVYQFDGLAPGAYRVLSTFEYVSPDTATMDSCAPKSATIGRGDTVTQDLDLFVLP